MAPLNDALALLDDTDHLDFAILDLNLDGVSAIPIADKLAAGNLPFAFVTGYGTGGIPSRFKTVERLDKPVEIARVVSLIKKAAASSTSAPE
ncbi:hypothetical protein [Rhizobium sp. N4311]|uniref:hypothetical protein n=1 Tax=Rhizobium sp. N4311 TaxID=1703972 RepID=UPI001FD9C1B4|nr:hypothetical protein [Rhizobium sp. N4311]